MEHPSLKDIEEVKKDFTIANEKLSSVKKEINNLVYGQNLVIDQILISILAEGHALIIGLPGLAKTRIVSFLSIILGFATKRVQFTPDLMPSDILGSEILEENAKPGKDFRFIEGPIFSQLLIFSELMPTTFTCTNFCLRLVRGSCLHQNYKYSISITFWA